MFYRENVIKTIFLGLYFCFIKLTTLKTFKSIFCTTRSRSRHFFVGSAPQHWQSDTERGQESLESLDESNTNIPKFDQKIHEKFDKKSPKVWPKNPPKGWQQKITKKIHQKFDKKSIFTKELTTWNHTHTVQQENRRKRFKKKKIYKKNHRFFFSRN